MSSGGGLLVFGVAVLSFWHVHAKDYALEAEEHPGAKLTAVWDENGERGRVEASERGVPFHDDLESLLSREDVDGVVVTTPTLAHREVIPVAARAGKHVFAEKVIAPTLGEAREVVAEVEEAGVTFVVSLPRLYAGYTKAIKEALAGGEIGEPTYLRVRVSHDGALPSAASPLGWLPERFFDPRQSAGGATIDFGAHPLYLLAHLLGMPDEVSAVYCRFTGRAVEDHSVVALLYPDGAIGVAEASFLGASAPFFVEAHGTEGSLLYDPSDGLRTRRRGAERWSTARVPADGGSPFRRWVELSSAGRTDPENVRAALELSALAEAANLSAHGVFPVRPGELP
jgi:1,5-anhydro-D-fructose reductase (1,5-anhydro-D-mannitol-forming)